MGLSILIGLVTSVIGSLIGIAIYMHYDLEGWFEERRIKRGRKLDEQHKKDIGSKEYQ